MTDVQWGVRPFNNFQQKYLLNVPSVNGAFINFPLVKVSGEPVGVAGER
jgi:hypothetical protein